MQIQLSGVELGHRSVTITNYTYDYLCEHGYRAVKKHRDSKLD